MAIVRTALGTGQSKTANINVVVGNNVVAGDHLIVVCASDASFTNMLWEPNGGGSPQHALVKDIEAINAGNVLTSIWRLSNAAPSTSANARMVVGNNFLPTAVCVSKYAGLAADPLDKSSVGASTGTSPSSGATAALAQADEICIGAVGTEGPLEDAAGTWSNSFNNGQRDGTTGGGAASNITVSEGYLVVAATTAQTAAKTSITSRDWAAAIATYKANLPPTVVLNTADGASFS